MRTNRRDFLRITGAAGAVLLIGCGSDDSGGDSTAAADTAPPGSAPVEGTVVFATWAGALPPSMAKAFERETGAKLTVRGAINSMEEFTATLIPLLVADQPTGYDLIDIDDSVIQKFIAEGWLEKLAPSAVKNASANVLDRFKAPEWDPGNDFQYPMSQTPFSIAYNRSRCGREITSYEDMLDPAFKGRTGLYSGAKASIANFSLLLRARGEIDNTPNELTVDEALTVIDFLTPYVEKGQFRVTGLNYNQLLTNGELWLSLATPTDVLYLDNPNIQFSYAQEGSCAGVDFFVIPKGSGNPRAAEAVIDFFYQPANQAKLVEAAYQFPVAKGVEEILAKTNPELLANPILFPPESVFDQMYGNPVWTDEEKKEVDAAWLPMIGN
jgi:spermidine/putrescine transport system substrate-binding protein